MARANLVPLAIDTANDVDSPRQLAIQQRVAHGCTHIDGDVALSLGGRCTEVWSQHDVVE